MATHSKRRNHISQLQDENGQCLVHHVEKAEALYVSFKQGLGINEFSQIHYDMEQLIDLVHIPIIDHPFIEDEIKSTLNDMPIDHAPGPDGFNGLFMKKPRTLWKMISPGSLLNSTVSISILSILMVSSLL
jgi:hypothetical protein